MKQRTKILSLFMAVLLTFGTVLSPLSMCVEAQDVTDTSSSEYRLILDIQQMGEGRKDFPFGYKNYNCETNDTQIIASKDYTNVITYCADSDGYLRVDDLSIELKGTSAEREVEFAVVDDAGVILTNHGKVVTINSQDAKKTGLGVEAFEIKQGENLHFVFHGIIASGNSMRLATKIMFSSDGETWEQKNSTGKLWASTNSNTSGTQGEEGFYYNYSTTYAKEEIKQDSVGIVYRDMRDGRSERADFPFMHVKNACMTNDIQIIASKGYTNVVAYQMPSDAQIKVEALKVWLLNTTSERTVEFAVVDDSGKVLSNDGEIAVINTANATKSGMSVSALELKQGQRLYFVFHSTEGSTNPIRCSAKIMTSTDGNTWTQANQKIYNGEPLVWPASTTLDGYQQGIENFYYGYSETYVTHEYTASSTELVDFVVEVEDKREPVILQLSDTQIIDPTQDRRSTPLSQTAKEYWAPEKINERLYDSLTETIAATNPDLILLTGDLVYGEFDDNGTMFESLIAKMESFGIPWAPVFGNHENESAKGVDWQCQQLENAEHCLFKQRTLTGNGNYTVGIKQNGLLTRVFFMMDSNGCGAMHANSIANGHSKKSIGFGQDQIDWSLDVAEKIKETSPDTKISYAFHIQIAAFADAYEKYGFTNSDTQENPINIDKLENKAEGDFGYIGRDLANPWDSDNTFFNQMKAVGVDSIFVGHEHCNSASVVYDGIRFQFGQKTGTYDRANFVKDDGTVYGASCSSDTPLSGGTVMVMASDGSFKNAYIHLTGDAQTKLDGTYNAPTIPGTATVPEPNKDGYMPTYKIDFEAANMVSSTVHSAFPLSMPNKEYDCMSNPTGNKVVSPGYMNITTYVAQESGTITLKNMTASVNVTSAPDNVVLFAVTDKDGNILYPTDGTLAVLNKDSNKVTGTFLKEYKVEKDDEINFIFEGVVGKTASCWISGIIAHYDSEGNETRLTREDGLIAPISGNTDQGADGFYYRYAKTFENVQTGYVTPPAPEVIPGSATIPEPNEDGYMPTYKINFEAENMVASDVHKDFPWSMPDKEYDCMTNPTGNKVVSPGYANIITYKVQETGTLTLKNMTASVNVTSAPDNVVLFAITDKEGRILYPSDGTLAVLNKENAKLTGIFLKEYKVKKGDEINFIFEGVVGKTASCWISGIIAHYDSAGNETRLTHESGYISPISGSTDQGADGFYYRYAKKFENVRTGYVTPPAPDVIPGNANVPEPNAEGHMPMYKIDFEAANMVASTVHKDFPWSMPEKEYDCMTNPSGNQIVSKGYANIITYKAQKDGTLTLKNMTAGINVTNAPENTVLFAITDKEGNVLYPADGTLAILNKDNVAIAGTFLKDYKVEKGDEINFIFEGVEGKTIACRIRGILAHTDSEGKETRLTREDGGYIAPISGSMNQGADGFYYRYAKTFKNVQIGYAVPPAPEVLPGNATVPVANAEGLLPTYKINFEAADMVASTVHKDFPYSMPDKEYDCMTNPSGNQIVSKGYANILTYTAQKSGKLTLKNMTASITVKNAPENVVLFAITDKEGNVLYPADGTLAVLNKDDATITGTFLKDYKVEKGDEINFIFEGVEGKTIACRIRGILVHSDSKGKETRLTREDGGYIAPISGSMNQGADGFYYRYAKTFENVQIGYAIPPAPEVLPGNPTVPVANEKGLVPKYKIQFEAADMVTSTVHKDFPYSMPDKEYHCMTNPSGNQIVSKGYANILTYTAQKSGKLTLKNMTASITVKNAPENVVLFAITDKEGNILYPSDGTMIVLNKDNESVTGTFLSQFEVKKGDELNFIFQGVEGKTIACRVRGIMLYIDSEGKETRLTREDGGYIAPISGSIAQGADGFSYRYAKKFENVILGYVAPKSKAVQWGEGIQVVVSNNPDDFVYYETATDGAATEKVDMLEIIKPGVELRYKYIPWIIVAVSGVVFGTQWVVFFIKRRKGVKQNEENS